ncbi:MAG: hypothetical protein GY884_23740 [Proteobacteria bacterium]|nr:hypothetical protein [Pseudomonadota bacterium]
MLLFLACGGKPVPETAPITNAEATTAAAAVICKAATEAGLTCTSDATSATVGEHTLTPTVTVDGFVVLPGSSIGMGATKQEIPGEVQLTTQVALAVDGAPLFWVPVSHAASNLDPDVARAKVLDEAMERWMVGYGLAVLDAVTDDPTSPALASVGMKAEAHGTDEWIAWGAYPMLKGAGLNPSTASRMGPGLAAMLGGLEPYLDQLDPGLHAVQVNAKLGGSDGPGPCGILPPMVASGQSASIVPLSGLVLVDGDPTGNICDLSEVVSWPLPPTGTTVEWDQFIVVRVR